MLIAPTDANEIIDCKSSGADEISPEMVNKIRALIVAVLLAHIIVIVSIASGFFPNIF